MRPVIKEHMTVDKTFGQQLQININISFHALTCAQVHVDAMDIAGQFNRNSDILLYVVRHSKITSFYTINNACWKKGIVSLYSSIFPIDI